MPGRSGIHRKTAGQRAFTGTNLFAPATTRNERNMKTPSIPEGCHASTPYLTVPDAARLIEFLKKAFDGIERARFLRPDGTVLHAQVQVADSLLIIGEPQGPWKPQPSMLYHYDADVDATYQQAIQAGAEAVSEPANMFYGDRSACVKDIAGNVWWLATRIENSISEEIQKRATAFFQERAKHAA